MPRKGPAVRREVSPDPVYQNPLVTQLINKVLLSGKKTVAEHTVYKALEIISEAGRGVLLYLRQEGRGIGLVHKIMAYELQDQGKDTVEANEALGFKADQRDYGTGAQILVELGVQNLRLMTNNPRKFVGLEGYGLKIVERLPIEIPASDASRRYLKTKKEKLGHLLRGL